MELISYLIDAQIFARSIPDNAWRAALVSTLQRQIEETHDADAEKIEMEARSLGLAEAVRAASRN